MKNVKMETLMMTILKNNCGDTLLTNTPFTNKDKRNKYKKRKIFSHKNLFLRFGS